MKIKWNSRACWAKFRYKVCVMFLFHRLNLNVLNLCALVWYSWHILISALVKNKISQYEQGCRQAGHFPGCCSGYSLNSIHVVWDIFNPLGKSKYHKINPWIYSASNIFCIYLWNSLKFLPVSHYVPYTHPRWWCACVGLKVIWKRSIFKEFVGSFLIFYELVGGIFLKKF